MPGRSAKVWRRRRVSPALPAAWSSTTPTRTTRWTRSIIWRPCRISGGRRCSGIDRPIVMTVVLQQGINGVVLGSLYVLVALGLTLIYGVLLQINFAHDDIMT